MIETLKELNVLYIDDDKVACENMQNTLSYFFKKVFIEHNGVDAIDIYHKEAIHLLLVDYDMPLMNGADFLQEIRKINDTIPAVIISSYSDKDKLMAAIELNLISYLVKPLEFSDLKNVLEKCVRWMEKYNLLKIDLDNNISYDLSTKVISQNKNPINTLTNYEFKIFEYLVRNKNKIVSFDEIFYILDNQEANKKSLTTIVYKINKKLPTPMIKNIKDVGYTFVGIF
jgi:DNA-binding response OmpR family regulator